MNSVFSFNKYKKVFFHFGCWLLPEKFSFCPKNNGFARVRGTATSPASWLVHLWTHAAEKYDDNSIREMK